MYILTNGMQLYSILVYFKRFEVKLKPTFFPAERHI
jgi:hypothetical protein